jgi:hypothetical protein
MITLADITEYIQTLCPIISINSDGVIEFDPSATQPQQTTALAIIADWLIGVYPAQLVANKDMENKWALVYDYENNLTVTLANGHKYAANKTALLQIGFKVLNPVSSIAIPWFEDWGNFVTSTVELQEVLNEADRLNQEYKNMLLGV